jgi:hypothetical protein
VGLSRANDVEASPVWLLAGVWGRVVRAGPASAVWSSKKVLAVGRVKVLPCVRVMASCSRGSAGAATEGDEYTAAARGG